MSRNRRPPPSQIPLIGQGQQQQPSAEAQIMAAINSLSLGIYTHLAVEHLRTRDDHQQLDPAKLQQLARDSADAGRAYFEGLGIIQTEANP